MGKMDEKEMIGITIIAFIFSPFILVGRLIKSIGESLGIVEPEKYEYNPQLDPNYVAPENVKNGDETPATETGNIKPQGFDNPNKLDPNS
jgi:hypothetical protein